VVAADRKPNIIVIFTDDHGYADLSCQGVFDDVRTPYMDSLARGGVRMTSGYATAPQCGPSRAGLISGQYQNKFGLDANGAGREATQRFWDLDLLPERLKKAGYVTGMAGKSHLGSNDSGELTQLGFDKVYFKHSNAPGHWNMNLEGKDMAPQVQKGGGVPPGADFAICLYLYYTICRQTILLLPRLSSTPCATGCNGEIP
jgi:uncharacterized sulfatase